jgi:magnesium transporter
MGTIAGWSDYWIIHTNQYIVFQAVISTYLSISLAKINVDPAVASGPLTTIISDITTLTMYFGLASLLLGSF